MNYRAQKAAGNAAVEKVNDEFVVKEKRFDERTGADLGFDQSRTWTIDQIDDQIDRLTDAIDDLNDLKTDLLAL